MHSKKSLSAEFLSCCAEVLGLSSWRAPSPLECFLLAVYVAIVAQPLVYGRWGMSVVALMTPVR